MKKPLALLASALVAASFPSILPAGADEPLSSRIIVSSPLNHQLIVLDAQTLAPTQANIASRGTSPVRLWVDEFDGERYLFSANHGIAGSVGIFDLDGDIILESPASPIPSGGLGAVGIAAARVDIPELGERDILAVTNTVFALGGCSMPAGRLGVYDATNLELGVLAPIGSYELDAAIPYAVAVDGGTASLYTASNCGGHLQVHDLTGDATTGVVSVEPAGTIDLPNGPDATLVDPARERSYTVNIGGNSLSVVDTATRTVLTTVPLPGAGPIDASLATSQGGSDWIVTANGRDDTFSIIDRDAIEACIQNSDMACPSAQVARISAGVPGGAPEGISYDPVSGRVFVVNKSPLGAPSLSAIQINEDGPITGTFVAKVPLGAVDQAVPVPAIIAFDVVTDQRS
jgi:YVTN family beta-propeller protein